MARLNNPAASAGRQRERQSPFYITLKYTEISRDFVGVQDYLANFVHSDPRNRLPEGRNIPIFDAPVVGIAAAADPLFMELPKPGIVGPIHVTPDFWLPGARSVISFFAPFSREIKATYKKRERIPPLEWVSGRLNGEVFINVMRRAILRLIQKQGGRAVVPNLELNYRARNLLPMWSERHVAFVAGVGTFGLHCGLLTEKGAAGRIGSVVTDLDFQPRERAYSKPYDYCLLKTRGICGACIKACPVGAINALGKDHQICMANGRNYIRPAYQEWGYHSCGHCQNNLPCSNGIPGRRNKTASINAREVSRAVNS
jgi:epoxyqueuosine reductase QueG